MRVALVALCVLLCGFVPPKFARVGATVRITDAGQLYSTINTIDCLGWPDDDTRQAAGLGAWSGWSPKNGDVGVPVARSVHCFQNDVMVVVVRFGTYLAPLGTRGLTFERGRMEDVPLFTKP